MTKQAALELLLRCLNGLMERSDAAHPAWNQEQIRAGKPNKWNYIDGLMISALLGVYADTGEARYLSFADEFVGDFVNDDGSIRTYDPNEHNLDNVSPARNLWPLYRLTGRQKYRLAMDTVYGQLQTMPRTKAGSFWHKAIYPYQVWLDGLFMAMPFYMTYDRCACGMAHCQDIYRQFQRVRTLMRDERTGLYYHGYDESRQMAWADPDTGCSPSFWLRSLGWLVMALCDTLEGTDEMLYYEYRQLQSMLRELVQALSPWQDAGGMFYQVPDHPGEPGNYLETSGTAMIAYGVLKAVRLGFLPKRCRAMGERAFQGIADRYIEVSPQGEVSVDGVCLVAGLGGSAHRDGTRAYYYSEPVVRNEAKGLAPLFLAMTEMMRLD